jgi:hypothetical protein
MMRYLVPVLLALIVVAPAWSSALITDGPGYMSPTALLANLTPSALESQSGPKGETRGPDAGSGPESNLTSGPSITGVPAALIEGFTPEPATSALLGAGFVVMVLLGKRRLGHLR